MKKINKKLIILPALALIFGLVGYGVSSAQVTSGFGAVAAPFTIQMDVGDRGPEVTKLQTFLAGNSSIYPEGLVTGYYGPLTEAAVMRFQSAYGISTAGRVGPQTLAQLNTLVSGGAVGIGDNRAPIIYGVAVNRTAGTATVSWNTDELTRNTIHYDNKPLTFFETSGPKISPFISGVEIAGSTTFSSNSHSLGLTNLVPGTTYYYIIKSVDQAGNVTVTWPASFVAL